MRGRFRFGVLVGLIGGAAVAAGELRARRRAGPANASPATATDDDWRLVDLPPRPVDEPIDPEPLRQAREAALDRARAVDIDLTAVESPVPPSPGWSASAEFGFDEWGEPCPPLGAEPTGESMGDRALAGLEPRRIAVPATGRRATSDPERWEFDASNLVDRVPSGPPPRSPVPEPVDSPAGEVEVPPMVARAGRSVLARLRAGATPPAPARPAAPVAPAAEPAAPPRRRRRVLGAEPASYRRERLSARPARRRPADEPTSGPVDVAPREEAGDRAGHRTDQRDGGVASARRRPQRRIPVRAGRRAAPRARDELGAGEDQTPNQPDEAGAAATEPVPPWVEPVDGACPETHPVKAKDSSGIYHLPGMLNYARTGPDRCYRDAAAAEADGYRAAKR